MLSYQDKKQLNKSARKTFWSYCCVLLSGNLQPHKGGIFSLPNSMDGSLQQHLFTCQVKEGSAKAKPRKLQLSLWILRNPPTENLVGRCLVFLARYCTWSSARMFGTSQMHSAKPALDLWEIYKNPDPQPNSNKWSNFWEEGQCQLPHLSLDRSVYVLEQEHDSVHFSWGGFCLPQTLSGKTSVGNLCVIWIATVLDFSLLLSIHWQNTDSSHTGASIPWF